MNARKSVGFIAWVVGIALISATAVTINTGTAWAQLGSCAVECPGGPTLICFALAPNTCSADPEQHSCTVYDSEGNELETKYCCLGV